MCENPDCPYTEANARKEVENDTDDPKFKGEFQDCSNADCPYKKKGSKKVTCSNMIQDFQHFDWIICRNRKRSTRRKKAIAAIPIALICSRRKKVRKRKGTHLTKRRRAYALTRNALRKLKWIKIIKIDVNKGNKLFFKREFICFCFFDIVCTSISNTLYKWKRSSIIFLFILRKSTIEPKRV